VLGLFKRGGAPGRVAGIVGLARAAERGLGLRACRAPGRPHRVRRGLTMKLGAKRLRSGGFTGAAGRRVCLQLRNLLLELRDLRGAWTRLRGRHAGEERRCRQDENVRSSHARPPHKAGRLPVPASTVGRPPDIATGNCETISRLPWRENVSVSGHAQGKPVQMMRSWCMACNEFPASPRRWGAKLSNPLILFLPFWRRLRT
jgi:hypothetical protein